MLRTHWILCVRSNGDVAVNTRIMPPVILKDPNILERLESLAQFLCLRTLVESDFKIDPSAGK